jgi:hypothetical protein
MCVVACLYSVPSTTASPPGHGRMRSRLCLCLARARVQVRTRTFSESVNGEDLTLMVPYCDLANHAFLCNATFCLSRDNKRCESRAACAQGWALVVAHVQTFLALLATSVPAPVASSSSC